MAYVDAVAGRAGVNVSRELHDYGVDGTFQSIVETPHGFSPSGFTVAFQLKATINWAVNDGHVTYDLAAKTFVDMVSRHRSAVPLILIVMCLPPEDKHWLLHSEGVLILRKCCYWLWLPQSQAPANTSTVRVQVPRTNLFTPEAVTGLLERAREYAMGVRDDV